MEIVTISILLVGLTAFVFRLSPGLIDRFPRLRPRPVGNMPTETSAPSVSIIVPVRNEEENIATFLSAIAQIQYPDFEIIVVDDHSTDSTAMLVESVGLPRLKLITAERRPRGWVGKSWACYQGASHASGQLLLFTDADTTHKPKSLQRAVRFLQARRLDMMSAIPYHRCPTGWEKLLGPFHLLILAITSPFTRPNAKRVFAIGQYLLFKRETYLRLGGHAAVARSFAEDLDFAELVLMTGCEYGVYPEPEIFEVRMYPSFLSFIKGWRRLQTVGMGHSTHRTLIETVFMVGALGSTLTFSSYSVSFWAFIAIVSFMSMTQRKYGDFSIIGAIVFPVSLIVFCFVSALGAYSRFVTRQISWRGRVYPLDLPIEAPAVDNNANESIKHR